MLALIIAAFLAAPAPSPLELARNQQDRATLEKLAAEAGGAASKSPNDPEAQYRSALAYSYLAEVAIELHDRKGGRAAAEQGIKAGERAVAVKPDSAEYYRVLGTLYGQAVTDIMSGLSYGPKAKDAINKAVEKAPKSSAMYVARGVGTYYLPAQLGGGAKLAIPDFQKAIELDSKNAEAYLWLGLSLRKENRDDEARKAFAKSLELNPTRLWAKQQLDKTPAK
ncbi:MAG TPA: tetratricopeptide repeat protein [Candidatus Acidoferrales bacterium]|nr:tetratricopeptide repeat protein [Candidatus Acidoferrales bacterium]